MRTSATGRRRRSNRQTHFIVQHHSVIPGAAQRSSDPGSSAKDTVCGPLDPGSPARDARLPQREEVRLRALLAGMLDPVVTIDSAGVIQEASESVKSVFGYLPGELVGRNVRLLMPEPHHAQHDEYLARYRRTGDTNILNRTREFEVVRKDGSSFVCELSVSRVEIPGKEEPLFIGSFRDVTARKRAERALAHWVRGQEAA